MTAPAASEPNRMPIRLITNDGVMEVAPESFRRLEIDLGNKQTLWVEGPRVYQYLNSELGCEILVMGPPGGIAHFHPVVSNSIVVAALREHPGEGLEDG